MNREKKFLDFLSSGRMVFRHGGEQQPGALESVKLFAKTITTEPFVNGHKSGAEICLSYKGAFNFKSGYLENRDRRIVTDWVSHFCKRYFAKVEKGQNPIEKVGNWYAMIDCEDLRRQMSRENHGHILLSQDINVFKAKLVSFTGEAKRCQVNQQIARHYDNWLMKNFPGYQQGHIFDWLDTPDPIYPGEVYEKATILYGLGVSPCLIGRCAGPGLPVSKWRFLYLKTSLNRPDLTLSGCGWGHTNLFPNHFQMKMDVFRKQLNNLLGRGDEKEKPEEQGYEYAHKLTLLGFDNENFPSSFEYRLILAHGGAHYVVGSIKVKLDVQGLKPGVQTVIDSGDSNELKKEKITRLIKDHWRLV